MELNLKSQHGKIVNIKGLTENSTIEQVKFKLEAAEGIPIDQLRIIYDGRQL